MLIWEKNTEVNWMEKNKIRKQALKERAALPKEDRDRASERIAGLLFFCSEYQNARQVFSYVAFREEADTYKILRRAIKDGKQVAVPKVVGPHHMEFYYIDSLEQLSAGYMGIPEPEATGKTPACPDEQTIFLVPGAAFDAKGGRIGYGGGFYDAYFSSNPPGIRVGIGFSSQIVPQIPTQEHDCCMDWIATEKGIEQCRNNYQKIR